MSSAIDDFIRGIEGRSRLLFNVRITAKHLGQGNFVLSLPDPADRRMRVKREVYVDLLKYEHLRDDLDLRAEYLDNVIRMYNPRH